MASEKEAAAQGQEAVTVVDKNGVTGVIDVTAPPPYDGNGPQVLVRLEDGQEVIVPIDALVERKEQGYFLPHSLREMDTPRVIAEADTALPPQPSGAGGARRNETVVVPLVAEELNVRKQQVETGRVRVVKTVREHEEVIDEPLMQEEINVERVAINRAVDAPPPVRYEGATMVVPLLEEVLVIEKRLMLKEELRITKRMVETHKPQRVTLRREEATIERLDHHGQDENEEGQPLG
ncbi:MAG: YsnF/AvaK domain-containing protein [Acidobacteriota bacterium]|nr:YsnF/AvaK domain-containing protein [Acidobacteriota bacterium]